MKRAAVVLAVLVVLVTAAACLPQPGEDGTAVVPIDGGHSYYSKWANSFPDDSSFFPITVFNADGVSGEAAKYKAANVNTIFNWYPGYSSQMQAEVAANQPLYVIDGVSGGTASTLKEVKANVSGDEPDGNGDIFCGGQPTFLRNICKAVPQSGTIGYPDFMRGRTDPASLNDMADAMRRGDPNRPVVNQFTKPVALYEGVYDPYNAQYLARSDIISYDYYPLTDPYERNKQLWDQCTAVTNMRRFANYSKPIWVFLEPTKLWGNPDGRTTPTPAQINAEAWQSVICGARGISWFKNDFSPGGTNNIFLDTSGKYAPVIQQITATDAGITQLAPVLNADFVNGFAKVTSGSVNYTVKYSANAYWLLAATTSLQPQTVSFQFTIKPNTSDERDIQVWNEGRTIHASNGSFSDNFAGETSVHIYKIS